MWKIYNYNINRELTSSSRYGSLFVLLISFGGTFGWGWDILEPPIKMYLKKIILINISYFFLILITKQNKIPSMFKAVIIFKQFLKLVDYLDVLHSANVFMDHEALLSF